MKLTAIIFATLLGLVLLLVVRSQREEIERLKAAESMLQGGDIKSAQTIEYMDSLRNELFIANTTITRYDIALENLREEDSVAAKKFEDKLSNIE